MDLIEVVPALHLVPLGISNAYLWHDAAGTILIDSGPPGSAPAIQAAMSELGLPREELRRIVLTHFHDDHAGATAELAAWSGASVALGAADADFVRHETPGPDPDFTASERELHTVVAGGL
ncbi:MBL fold metallo-hydrolase [Sporichthya sp.]|uniref:MBL fold metallo-hydrolase n=1 Tax=Sporichthya sp. TaxID=65475 RepID=UPI0017A1792C|nr:MBL fold metallo-hydrolase [Sporichthya sp.]MBA3743350.1 MBL fold metallo-hydrolase [Sporichthya sp.]